MFVEKNKHKCTMDQELYTELLMGCILRCLHSPDSSTSAWNDVMAAILKVWHQIRNPTPSIDAYLLEEQSSKSDFKRWEDEALDIFEDGHPNKMSSKGKGSV